MSAPLGIIVVSVLVVYGLAYMLYGRRILERQIVKASADRKTPAIVKFDGVDYVPANKYVLYGHHFASIAGAGPIVGPAIAMAYGWGLPLIWVLFGNVFIGAVHDYLALMASVRHGGLSIMSVSENVMGRKAKYIFLIYVYAALLLVLAAFFSVNAKLFTVNPSAATKAMIYMPAAVLVGYLLYRTRMTPSTTSILAVLILLAAIAYSIKVPFRIPGIGGIDTYHTWLLLLAAYSWIASVLPVWYLLQPRDYLNAFLLWSFVGLAIVGSLAAAVHGLTGPFYTEFSPPIFSGVPTPFWPAIALIIACGSLSGFHSVVASGTTSKQLANELDALLVGYGGMLTEGAVSSLAVIAPIALAWNQPDFPQLLESMGKAKLVSAYTQHGILGLDKVSRFVMGYGYMVGKAAGSITGVGVVAAKFAAIALATFILTTLDSATRLARFAWQEMFDWLEERSPRAYKAIANMYVGGAIAVLAGLAMAYPNVVIKGKELPAYNVIWPAFAGTNQLLAALALLTSALWVYAVLKVRETRYTLLIQTPAWFLWITVTTGLAWWTIKVLPKLPAIQKVGAGTLVIISLAIDLLLIALYVTGLYRARKERVVEALRAT
ncbi:MAG: carbon starvation protein A [Hyperthermus sp.]|nr:MAG: carbon starvation protein A [Hyperthermus sp.]